MDALQSFAEDLWIAEGPIVRFFGVPYPTRMIVVKLADGSLWINSPVEATREEAAQLASVGPVAHLVSPTRLHDWRLQAWTEFYPNAQVWTTRALRNLASPPWQTEIDQILFRGSIALSEVEFFHRRSRTLIIGDFLQNFQPQQGRPLWNALLHIGGVQGGAPRDLRLSFLGKPRRRMGRQALYKMLAWDFDKVVVAHGDCLKSDAKAFVERSFRWLDEPANG